MMADRDIEAAADTAADVPRCQHVSPSPWGPTQCVYPAGHDGRHAYSPSETIADMAAADTAAAIDLTRAIHAARRDDVPWSVTAVAVTRAAPFIERAVREHIAAAIEAIECTDACEYWMRNETARIARGRQ